ncbi:MAG: hypothetical protein HZB56_08870 [Deltaproteobacteria bacterium]|nr:hypothetical protein [Deltaproteobacteria bacterium]
MKLQIVSLLVMTALMLGWRFLLLRPTGLRSRVPLQNGVAVLRPPRGRNLMFAGLALGPTMLLVAVLAKVGREGQNGQFGLVLAAGLLALGGWLVVWLAAAEFRQCLRVDGRTIERVFAITRLRVRWSEVERITWNPGSRWFFIVAAGAWLWVPVDLEGIGDFAQHALVSLPPAVLQSATEARAELEFLAKVPPGRMP